MVVAVAAMVTLFLLGAAVIGIFSGSFDKLQAVWVVAGPITGTALGIEADGALLVRWGARVTPLAESTAAFPPLTDTALSLVNRIRAAQDPGGRSQAGLTAPVFAEARLGTRA